MGIDYSKINEAARLVQELSEQRVPSNRPFIGDDAYTIESGIVTGWFKNVFKENRTTVFPVHPNSNGCLPKMNLGK